MTKSKIFHTNAYKRIERDIVKLINSREDFMSARSITSPRAAGDAIQSILAEEFQSIIKGLAGEYSATFARRAMADLAFTDLTGLYYVVDVKTQRADTHFNMPNLTSVERLSRLYEDDSNYFVVLMVKYFVSGLKLTVSQVHFLPIEFLSWDCLTIGALGWGQIQIANANRIVINPRYSRKRWMIELCDILLEFYPKEIGKIAKRLEHFKQLKRQWERKPE